MTALTFSVSSWTAGTQNLPGRARHCSEVGDSVRPQDLLETSICLTRVDKREEVRSDLRNMKKRSEQYLHTLLQCWVAGRGQERHHPGSDKEDVALDLQGSTTTCFMHVMHVLLCFTCIKHATSLNTPACDLYSI